MRNKMKQIESESLKKIIDKKKQYLLISLVVGILSLCILFGNITLNNNQLNNKKDINEIINEKNVVDKIANLNVNKTGSKMSYELKDSDHQFIMISNGEHYYILRIKPSDSSKVLRYANSTKTYDLTVVTKKVSNELKEEAIRKYNSLNKDNQITNDSEFTEIFRDIYLDATVTGSNSTILINIIFMVLSLSGFSGFIVIKGYLSRTKKNIKNASEEDYVLIQKEWDQEKANPYEKGKIVLTDHFVIYYAGAFEFIKYEDILWVGVVESKDKYNRVTDYTVMIKNENGKNIIICRYSKTNSNAEQLCNEIKKHIQEKNPNILLDDTKKSN